MTVTVPAAVWRRAQQDARKSSRDVGLVGLAIAIGAALVGVAVFFLLDDDGRAAAIGLGAVVIVVVGASVVARVVLRSRLAVLGHQVGSSRLMGGLPPSALWWR